MRIPGLAHGRTVPACLSVFLCVCGGGHNVPSPRMASGCWCHISSFYLIHPGSSQFRRESGLLGHTEARAEVQTAWGLSLSHPRGHWPATHLHRQDEGPTPTPRLGGPFAGKTCGKGGLPPPPGFLACLTFSELSERTRARVTPRLRPMPEVMSEDRQADGKHFAPGVPHVCSHFNSENTLWCYLFL